MAWGNFIMMWRCTNEVVLNWSWIEGLEDFYESNYSRHFMNHCFYSLQLSTFLLSFWNIQGKFNVFLNFICFNCTITAVTTATSWSNLHFFLAYNYLQFVLFYLFYTLCIFNIFLRLLCLSSFALYYFKG